MAEARSRLLGAASDREAIAEVRSGIPALSSRVAHEFVAVIAEIKRSSPSRGVINSAIDSAARAKQYETGGASALSVLTEPDRFGGSDDDLMRVMQATTLPVLRKDFHVTALQLEHAARLGASAALVIVRSVSPSKLRELAAAGRELDLEIVFEVRDERELERALESGARVVGVNNRNLETLEIDRDTVSRIVPLVPADCVAIAESGYSSPEAIKDAAAAGADAVLVGSYLSASRDPVAAVKGIASVPRRPRRD